MSVQTIKNASQIIFRLISLHNFWVVPFIKTISYKISYKTGHVLKTFQFYHIDYKSYFRCCKDVQYLCDIDYYIQFRKIQFNIH